MDKYKILYSAESIFEIREAANWYNNRQERLGEKFKKELKSAIEKLKINPFSFYIRYEKVRIIFPKKFPFAAHYIIDETTKTVKIIAVLAFKQDTESYWLKRQ